MTATANGRAAETAAQQRPKAAKRQKGDGGEDGEGKSQPQRLLALAEEGVELFHDADDEAFATVIEGKRRFTSRVDGRAFKSALLQRFHREHGIAPSDEPLRTAVRTLEARARFDGPEREVALRIARGEGTILINLGREDGALVEITPNGWRIVSDAPIRFIRSPGMLPLPIPERGGRIASLAQLLHVETKADFLMVVGWLLGALAAGPYPIAALTGEQGAAKSSSSRTLRRLIDPNRALLRSLPKEERDLAVTAMNSHVLAFDNVSGLPAWLSDALCKLATGGGFSCRALYTDNAEFIFDGRRPIINGIEDFATRGDLADRCLMLRLSPIPEGERRTEAELDQLFQREAARLLGVLLDAAAYGLANPMTLRSRPRMADFAEWVASCEGFFEGAKLPFDAATAVWRRGDFMLAYSANRRDATETVLDADSVGVALRAFMEARTSWTGTATDLLGELATLSSDGTRRDREWPANARGLAGKLRRLAPALRRTGIEIEHIRAGGKTRARLMTITYTQPPEFASEQSDRPKSEVERGVRTQSRTVRTQSESGIVRNKSLIQKDVGRSGRKFPYAGRQRCRW
ncbi:hypothetical protein T281_16735 [Rhodomicrobium udaipurense JA643]|uniref:ATP-binding protein n=1 Tax=Rhodomicrobium udaipurense TaxID=1202716 RepID=A0A8I1GHT4_9HYPH|nr:hypothetical protein [Rhodomicrobium udaipurense]KAI93427.1 hypothetical protein T281_16735 [Rhodomicrobium udaipurense JA643]MBJ7545174.1 hypothetical protein [Rhodomicrobium udaipurense]